MAGRGGKSAVKNGGGEEEISNQKDFYQKLVATIGTHIGTEIGIQMKGLKEELSGALEASVDKRFSAMSRQFTDISDEMTNIKRSIASIQNSATLAGASAGCAASILPSSHLPAILPSSHLPPSEQSAAGPVPSASRANLKSCFSSSDLSRRDFLDILEALSRDSWPSYLRKVSSCRSGGFNPLAADADDEDQDPDDIIADQDQGKCSAIYDSVW